MSQNTEKCPLQFPSLNVCPTSRPNPKDIHYRVMLSRKILIFFFGCFCFNLLEKLLSIFSLGDGSLQIQTQCRWFEPGSLAEIPSRCEPALPHRLSGRSDHPLIARHLLPQCILLYADKLSWYRSQFKETVSSYQLFWSLMRIWGRYSVFDVVFCVVCLFWQEMRWMRFNIGAYILYQSLSLANTLRLCSH